MADSRESLSEQLLMTLPFLRRYARALTGSQSHGDEWVRLCVEVLLQQPALVRDRARSRVEIFRLFHKLQLPFRALDKGQGAGGPASLPDRQHPGRQGISDVQRKVLLLTMLEDFSIEQTAEILDLAPHEAEAALDAAREALRQGMPARVLVIEDESVIALNVAQIVRSAGHQVIGIAASEKSAIDLAEKHTPDLVIADVQLRGEDDGRAAVREILKSLSVPVIFVTGFPERLLTGQGIEPTFVVTKPFAPDHLKTAISQALSPGEV